MAINSEKLRSAPSIFLMYIAAASLLIFIFRFIFPGSEAPLMIYSRNWRLIQGVLDFFNLFPALALSALVIPFGLAAYEENYQSFSDLFFKRISTSIITAIAAAVVYAAIFFLVLPMVKNYEENIRFSGELYQLAKKNAIDKAEAGEWYESSQFIEICDHIWYKSEELNELRDKITINLEKEYFEEIKERANAREALIKNRQGAEIVALSENQEPVDATEAIEMSAAAFNERRFFDAHWLANLGMRLSPDGSTQEANARRMASESWNMITSLAPNKREERLNFLYNMKLSGYQAMNARKWVDAYYIFLELLSYTPDDPDAKNFFAVSERNAIKIAFFTDEINLTIGETVNNPLFSLPADKGRAVLRFSALTTSLDVSYGIGFEYMRFDENNNLEESVISSYAKILPFTNNNTPQVLVLTHALDREHEERSVDGEWLVGNKSAGGILLDVSYDIFLLITQARFGLPNFQINELFQASKELETAGFISRIFHAEILYRFSAVLFFLPMSIFIIIIGWRYRAKTKPRYLFILLLPILPVVFHSLVFLYRTVLNTLGIWLVITFGFIPALITISAAFALLLIISLISLSAQRS